MKTLSLLFVSILSLTACATDETDPYRSASGLRPAHKPEIGAVPGPVDEDTVDITESSDPAPEQLDPDRGGILDGTLDGAQGEWAEEIIRNGERFTLIRNPRGLLEVVDDNGDVVVNELGE